jgi:hypothetical protein
MPGGAAGEADAAPARPNANAAATMKRATRVTFFSRMLRERHASETPRMGTSSWHGAAAAVVRHFAMAASCFATARR